MHNEKSVYSNYTLIFCGNIQACPGRQAPQSMSRLHSLLACMCAPHFMKVHIPTTPHQLWLSPPSKSLDLLLIRILITWTACKPQSVTRSVTIEILKSHNQVFLVHLISVSQTATRAAIAVDSVYCRIGVTIIVNSTECHKRTGIGLYAIAS